MHGVCAPTRFCPLGNWRRGGGWVLSLLLLLSPRLSAEDWPQFRGPNCNGVSTSRRALPTEFSFQEKVAWSLTLGEGIASPIVAGGRVFATAMTGPQTFSVFGLEATTGKRIWTQELPTGALPRITPPNSHASSTPASDGQRVYVYISTLGLLAFDAADGKELWRLPLPRPAYLMDWGAGTSPIVYGDLVIFNQDDDLRPYLLAVEASTGKVRWRTERPEMLGGYAVPVLCEANGRTEIVVAGTGKLKGYEPSTGRELWTCNTLLRTVMTTPVVRDGIIYVAVQSYGDSSRLLKSALLEWLDTNQDGKLIKAEVPKEFWDKFDLSDLDRNGVLEGAELDQAFVSPANSVGGGNTIQAVRGGGTGDVTKTHVLWNLHNRAPSNLSSPLVFGNELYVVKRGGLSSCFDRVSGKTHWEVQRLRNLGEYFASPVGGDGKIFITGENGFVVVLAPGPQLRILARNDMGGSCLATPAIANGRLYIRTREKLYCITDQAK